MVHPEGTKSPPGLVHHRPDRPARIVVLVSGSGTNLQALIDAENAEKARESAPAFGATVVAVGADRTDIQGLDRAEQAGIPTFALRVKDFATREEWDRALRDKVAEYEPDLVVSAGFMKLLGADFLAAFDGRVINTHPALSPSFPGMHGPRRRAGLRREGHRLHRASSSPAASTTARWWRRPPSRSSPATTWRACTSASRRRSGRCSWTSWAGWPAKAGPSTTERSLSSEQLRCAPGRRHPPDQARAGQRVRQDRAGGAGPRPARRRDRPGLHRRLGQADPRPGPPGHRGRRAHRLPGVPGRPGQDPASEGARRHPGRPAAGGPPQAARRARRRALRPGGGEPLPVHPDRRLRREPRRVRRADRHRRPVDGPRRGEEPPERGRRGQPGELRRGPGRRGRRRLHPRAAQAPGRRGLRAHRRVRRRGGRLVRLGLRPRRASPASRTSSPTPTTRKAVLRYGENPHQGAALYTNDGRAGHPGHRRAAARQGDVLQQLRGHRRRHPLGPRLRRGLRRDHQARQPLRHRGQRGRRHRRGAPAGQRVRPGLGLRRHHRRQPHCHQRDGAAGQRGLHRGHLCAGLRAGGAGDAEDQEEHPAF